MNDSNNSTTILLDKLLQCDDLETFHEYSLWLSEDRIAWKEKINAIIKDNKYTLSEFADLCDVSRTAVSKWCSGSIPYGRDEFIKIGFAAHYNLQQLNFFLQRYGKFPALYAKSLEDSVYIFVLNSSNYPHTFAFCCDIITKIKTNMERTENRIQVSMPTTQLNEGLMTIESVEELSEFIQYNAASYRDAYNKLYAYVKAFIMANNFDPVNNRQLGVNSLADMQGWTSSLRQCVSAINQKKWFPIRRKIIVLGLHLNMTINQINEMLQMAQMERLCAKNPVESAIIYAVEDAELNNMICCDGSNDLCKYVKIILEKLEIQDSEKFLDDL